MSGNYNDWDKKAKQLVEEAEKDDEEEKKKSDEALGLQDGPQGPPVAKAKEQRKEMSGHSSGRKNFIAEQQAKEIVVTHTEQGFEAITLVPDEVNGRAVRIRESKDVTYNLGKEINLLKVFVEKCVNVKIIVGCPLATSFIEINHCENIEVRCEEPVSTFQCDECTKGYVRAIFLEPENVGAFYHQNCPSLEVSIIGQDPLKIGRSNASQLCTRPGAGMQMITEEVLRGEKEFPVNLNRPKGDAPYEPDAEAMPATEEAKVKAEAKRAEGNEAFKANDFLQAAVYYTEAISHDPDMHLAYANRAQCFLKTGQSEKALDDAVKVTEIAPEFPKGWFRKGMALHATKRYGAAIIALAQAEKLDPKNDQIPEAIKMAQLMARKHGPGDDL